MIFQHLVNSFEDTICFGITTAARPPAFDNPCVISKDFYAWEFVEGQDGFDEELHTNGLGPTNVSSTRFPVW